MQLIHKFILLTNTMEMSFVISGTIRWIGLTGFYKFLGSFSTKQLHLAREIYMAAVTSTNCNLLQYRCSKCCVGYYLHPYNWSKSMETIILHISLLQSPLQLIVASQDHHWEQHQIGSLPILWPSSSEGDLLLTNYWQSVMPLVKIDLTWEYVYWTKPLITMADDRLEIGHSNCVPRYMFCNQKSRNYVQWGWVQGTIFTCSPYFGLPPSVSPA